MDFIIWAFTVFMLSYVLPFIYSIKLRCIVCTKTVISNCSQIPHSESIQCRDSFKVNWIIEVIGPAIKQTNVLHSWRVTMPAVNQLFHSLFYLDYIHNFKTTQAIKFRWSTICTVWSPLHAHPLKHPQSSYAYAIILDIHLVITQTYYYHVQKLYD